MILKNKNGKDWFLSLVLWFLHNLSGHRENTGNCWYELFKGICTVNALTTPNLPLVRGEGLSGCIYDPLKHFWEAKSIMMLAGGSWHRRTKQ